MAQPRGATRVREEPEPLSPGCGDGYGLPDDPDHADPAGNWPPPVWLPEEHYNSALWESM